MAKDREDIEYRGHRIIANNTGFMIYPDKYRGEVESIEEGLTAAKAWVDDKNKARNEARRAPHIGTVDDYAEALEALSLGAHERLMLVAHRAAPDRKLSATELSEAAGWEEAGPANMHYGNLGRKIAQQLYLPIENDDDLSWTQALAEYHDEESKWEMHAELGEALDRLNIT
ncbi:hypothetical protein [Robiginitomaculum antarcticum]|uniref:hypothetical protein n=1 Tax=Robiginitomaculum antarcticum TaxID=437507 RepID=UPI00036555F0|nr:hypothetical protein [Robiginitomaculum antarcticum]